MEKKYKVLIVFLQALFTLVHPAQKVVEKYNEKLASEGLPESFKVDDGHVIFDSPSFSPPWAVKNVLDTLGIVNGYGTGGVDPYKFYSKEKWEKTTLSNYFVHRGFTESRWDQNIGTDKHPGIRILVHVKSKLGEDAFKRKQEMEAKKADRAHKLEQYALFLVNKLVPLLVSGKFLFLAGFVATMVIIVPTIIKVALPAILAFVLAKRPTIIGPNDSDIYKNIIGRLLYRAPKLPEVIVNLELEEELEKLIERNKTVTQHNKRSKEKKKYIHALLYGQAGVGKTLFAKKLAEKSKMHYMYFSVADLSQMEEEEALQTLKELFVYAKKFNPCILIIDEADLLFDKNDLKAQKIVVLFQKEFSKATNSKIQLIFITNYPNKFTSTIINRIGQILFFDVPTFETQKKLFALHLRLSKIKPEYIDRLVDSLEKKQIEGLVGRDIESICVLLSLEKEHNKYELKKVIKKHKVNKKNIERFKMPEEKN